MNTRSLFQRQQTLISALLRPELRTGDVIAALRAAGILTADDQGFKLVAKHVFEKRTRKIRSVLPKTFQYLEAELTPLLEQFFLECPQENINSVYNALQFFEFILRKKQALTRVKPYVWDVAAFEAAYAKVNVLRDRSNDSANKTFLNRTNSKQKSPTFRLCPYVELLKCSYDIQGLLVSESCIGGNPEKRNVNLVIARPHQSRPPVVFEAPETIFTVLEALKASNSEISEDSFGNEALVARLTDSGILHCQ